MTSDFVGIFKQPDSLADRGKYLARVFGIFSEELVRIWAADPRAPYEDLGRPILRTTGALSGSTLDFTLRHRATCKIYVAEMKCEIEYQNYRYFVLTDSRQLEHHGKPAFEAFQAVAARSQAVHVYVGKQEITVDGAILIWGAATPDGRARVMAQQGFSAVLTIEEIIDDLRTWKSAPFQSLMTLRRTWANEMYDALLGDAPLKSG